jgi:chaperonin GroES
MSESLGDEPGTDHSSEGANVNQTVELPNLATRTAKATAEVTPFKNGRNGSAATAGGSGHGGSARSGAGHGGAGHGGAGVKGKSAVGVAGKARAAALPICLMHDRILVLQDDEIGERRSTGGIVIPATAQVGKRLVWAKVVGVGPNVRSVEAESRVLFEPDDRFEIEIQGEVYLMLRERDIHAVATEGVVEGSTGLYL